MLTFVEPNGSPRNEVKFFKVYEAIIVKSHFEDYETCGFFTSQEEAEKMVDIRKMIPMNLNRQSIVREVSAVKINGNVFLITQINLCETVNDKKRLDALAKLTSEERNILGLK